MKKLRCYISLEKEEKWLNEMRSRGWELDGKHTKYEFRKSPPNNTIIKIDYRNFKSKDDFQNYITLFNDFGWEHIAGTKTSGKQYFKKTDERDGDDIFSDVSSNAERYKKLSTMWLSMAACYIPIFISLVTTKTIGINEVLNPKLLYYTPGLWQRTGTSFFTAFLIETPFAMMRGYFWLIFLCLIILYTIFALKARIYYQKTNLKNQI
ncbi:DUF2812 domain-containing protein [Clostridium estertheticum]|uniref:DUF2812 domain-containing protein n=1 Tax=Clostridium estertheticum TaxID=238834 RepID=UPI00124EDAC9|nr:DUF2812 domain-containing protein [Clostridium estertheticum]MBZ9618492.1 DUF2812 domain-containing protein [Clostridium estertheticum subsp. laramiense]WAG76274.1 DUF2812 domain-containing protein [Clostridium estertheticum]